MENNNNNHLETSYATAIICLVGLIICTAFPHPIEKIAEEQVSKTSNITVIPTPTPQVARAEQIPVLTETPIPVKTGPFDNMGIIAKSALVYNATQHKVVYEKNSDEILPLASLTKIMTAVTAFDLATTSKIVTIEKNNLAEDGDSGLLVGEKWDITELLRYTLVVSSNDGASAIASLFADFISSMNSSAKKIGLKNSVFFNETGLDQSATLAGAYGSARDVADMLLYADSHYPDTFNATSQAQIEVSSADMVTHVGINTDSIAGKINGLIAGKTGYTVLAGGNLAVLYTNPAGDTMAAVALGSTYDGRFSDVLKLVQAGNKALFNN